MGPRRVALPLALQFSNESPQYLVHVIPKAGDGNWAGLRPREVGVGQNHKVLRNGQPCIKKTREGGSEEVIVPDDQSFRPIAMSFIK